MTFSEARSKPAVELRAVDIVFGERRSAALAMIDQGKSRQEILDATGAVLGAAGVSLRIETGEICVLMGLSGSGKSTVLRAVNGLNPVARGEVLVADGEATVDVASCSEEVLRRLRQSRVTMVFQQFALLPWRTVRENVGLGLELKGMAKPERDAIVDGKLAMVGLDKWADKYAHELSGGMQQRVGLARALAADPEIILMDEPFSALDPLIRRQLQDEFRQLTKSLGKSAVFITHDLDEAIRIGDRIAIMKDGVIIQIGTSEEIILAPADDYVADFVAGISRLHLIKAHSVMESLEACRRADPGLDPADLLTTTPEADIDELIDLTMRSTRDGLAVVDNGAVVGVVTTRGLLRGVKGGRGAAAAS